MVVLNTKAELEQYLLKFRSECQSVGFVPTMGAIHAGHLSLIAQSLKENEVTVVSVFVNPTQFNNAVDLEKYPRNIENDVDFIKSLSGEVVVFAPEIEEMYPHGMISESFTYGGLEFEMEGAQRPGHFDGVGTIVKRLFEMVQPAKAYFGEKDFQQLQIIKKMVATENLPVQIVGCPIYREKNGVAMSSRNALLSEDALKQADFLYSTLVAAKKMFETEDVDKVQRFVESEFKNNSNFELEYFTIAEEETLKSISKKEIGVRYRGFLVAHIENVRLIDNISFN